MNTKEKFLELARKLSKTHELVGSCNADKTLYLIPKGTSSELSYSSKPKNSYRYSDHWSWYANVKKCSNMNYIQCYLAGYEPSNRKTEFGASEPKSIEAIGYTEDGYIYKEVKLIVL